MINSLLDLPDRENDSFEFKSSLTSHKDLGDKICKAASAFSNSGGGLFVAGVDDNGEADGGFSPHIGRTSLPDWIDQKLHLVQPAVQYEIKLFTSCDGKGTISPGNNVAAIEFGNSSLAPHMSIDNRYYVRAGAHSHPANSFLVESLWAKRALLKPVLRHHLRRKPDDTSIIQLVIAALTDAPAVDVELDLSPLGSIFESASQLFPISISLIDKTTPFVMDIGLAGQIENMFGSKVTLTVEYKGQNGESFSIQRNIKPYEGLSPIQIGGNPLKDIAKSLDSIAKNIGK